MPIAFDATSTATGAATLTWSHTCTGNSRILFVGVLDTVAADNVTGATYAGVAMTLIAKQANSAGQYAYLFYLISPATGANNIAVTASAADVLRGDAISYTGAKQSNQPDSSNTGTAVASATFAPSTTSVADNCWIVSFGKNLSGANTAGANTVVRQDSGAVDGCYMADSNAARSAGANALNLSTAVATDWAGVIASIAPSSGAGFFAVF